MILAVLAFIVTGLMYLFALGNERSGVLDNAKNNFKYAIIALVTVGSAYVIINTIDYLLSGTAFF
jgi:heme/copper-type cytochrome/quinol oxidase subunit 4